MAGSPPPRHPDMPEDVYRALIARRLRQLEKAAPLYGLAAVLGIILGLVGIAALALAAASAVLVVAEVLGDLFAELAT